MNMMSRTIICGLVLGSLAMTGCRGDRSANTPRQFFPSLDDQPRYDSQEQSGFFADGRVVREPVANTVAFGRFGRLDPTRANFLRDDDELYRGRSGSNAWTEFVPVNKLLSDGGSVAEMIQLGQKQFNIYCIVCHGGVAVGGQGTELAGTVGDRWSYPIPNLHDPQYQLGGEKGRDGYVFNVIRNGVPNEPGIAPPFRMKGYSTQVSEREAWAIVLYLRTLQRARNSTINDVPQADRATLTATQGATP